MTDVIKIANCSGFYGDKLSAAREMVEGGPIDVLTGDYLAELTMAILYNQKMTRDTCGYVGTFLKQVREVLQPILTGDVLDHFVNKTIGQFRNRLDAVRHDRPAPRPQNQ